VSRIPKPVRASLYSGATGIAFSAIELGTLFGDERLIARGCDELERATADVDDDTWLDVLGGSAGAIQALLTMAACHAVPAFVEVADVHGHRLLQKARRSDRGWSWDTLPGQSSDHLLGYGHGAGGIACALLELSVATANEEYRHGALEAFRYERSFFSHEHHNWPDLRVPATPPQQAVYAVAWCHGGPGIGLSRLRARQLIADEGAERDLGEALQLTVGSCGATGSAAGVDLSLCHGVGGNADLLIEAATIRNRPDLLECAERAGRQAIETYVPDDLPWPCGVTSGGETPNLMLGLAGIGHFFLRLHDPHRVPSINLVKPAYDVARAGALVSASEGAAERAVWS
jgi:class II lanthipeptide synthase